MNEDILHVIWKYGLLKKRSITAVNGDEIDIVHCGVHNFDAGPDFLNARIRINGLMWVGNVEIHKRSSDWFAHKHQQDKAYDNVILHVVLEHNKTVINSKGNSIPTIEVASLINDSLIKTCDQLLGNRSNLPCNELISSVDSIYWTNWLERMAFERMEQKVKLLKHWLADSNNDWEQVAYLSLARAYGAPVNSFGMEWLARSLPLAIIKKCRFEGIRVEALLFGQAGMLSHRMEDHYFKALRKEYKFLKKKYNLKPISDTVWKYHRLRPSSFPTLRISQFAALVCIPENLFNLIRLAGTSLDLCDIFRTKTTDYWDDHYRFGDDAAHQVKRIGKDTAQRVVLNAVCPILFLYGAVHGNEELQMQSLELMKNLPPEDNRYTAIYERYGRAAGSAMESQAMIHLFKSFCSKRKCLNCNVGIKILSKSYEVSD